MNLTYTAWCSHCEAVTGHEAGACQQCGPGSVPDQGSHQWRTDRRAQEADLPRCASVVADPACLPAHTRVSHTARGGSQAQSPARGITTRITCGSDQARAEHNVLLIGLQVQAPSRAGSLSDRKLGFTGHNEARSQARNPSATVCGSETLPRADDPTTQKGWTT